VGSSPTVGAMSKTWKPGDVVAVKVGGKGYTTIFDENGVQRFRTNTVLDFLFQERRLDLNQLEMDYRQGRFNKRDYAEVKMALGYSVSRFADLSAFQDWCIENPVWT
jgi:hypothetical protein